MTNDPQLLDVIGVLRRRRTMIIGVAVIGTVLILFGAMLIRASYTAAAEIVLVSRPGATEAPQLSEQAILTKVTELSAQSLLRRAADNLSRDPTYQLRADDGPADPLTAGDFLRRTLRSVLPRWMSPWQRIRACRRLAVRTLRRHLTVEQTAGSHVIAIRYTSADPVLAALVANRITTLYLKSQTEAMQADARRALVWLGTRIPEQKSRLADIEAAIQAYRASHGLVGMSRSAVADDQYADLNRQLVAAESRLAVDQSRMARMGSAHGAAVLADTFDTPTLSALRAQEAALQQTEAQRAAYLGANNPQMRQIANAVRMVQRKIGEELGRAEAALREQARIAANQVRMLRQRLARVRDPSSDMRLAALDRRAASDRRSYDELRQRREAMVERLQTASSGFQVVSRATAPDRPSSPNPLLFGPPALVFLLMCGSLAAVVMDRLDMTLRSESQVSDVLGIPCVGFLPRVQRRIDGRPLQSLLKGAGGTYVEAIRSIFTAVLLTRTNPPQFVLVTSSVPGEGKTTLATSFATYAAQLGWRTILLDLDFHHPATPREFEQLGDDRPRQDRASDLPVREGIQRLPGLKLDYVPMAHAGTDPLPLFASGQMHELLDRLRGHYDCIVADAAPALPVTETRILAAMADQVLFAVKWNSTDRRAARNALDLLRRSGVRTDPDDNRVAAVLTQIELREQARIRDGSAAEAFVRYGKFYV